MTTAGKQAHGLTIVPIAAHVVIEHDGVVLADTRRATTLNEGSLPTRYYVPTEDVAMDMLEPTDSSSHCPFKGDASYWSVRVGDEMVKDLAWSYAKPITGAEDIAGLICFYNEKVDISVDGEAQPRPKTHWS